MTEQEKINQTNASYNLQLISTYAYETSLFLKHFAMIDSTSIEPFVFWTTATQLANILLRKSWKFNKAHFNFKKNTRESFQTYHSSLN